MLRTAGVLVTRLATSWRDLILSIGIVVAAGVLVAVLGLRLVKEGGGTNSYALVAESLLTATPWTSTCFDGDCAGMSGHQSCGVPPLPGVVAMPLVAAFGVRDVRLHRAGAACIGGSASSAGRASSPASRSIRSCEAGFSLAVAFASPLYYVTLRSEGVWFFAQALAFPLLALAIDRSLARRFFVAGLRSRRPSFAARCRSSMRRCCCSSRYHATKPLLRIEPDASASHCVSARRSALLSYATLPTTPGVSAIRSSRAIATSSSRAWKAC